MVAHFVYHDRFTQLNGIGLVVLLAGVSIFNWYKYTKMVQLTTAKDIKNRHSSSTAQSNGYGFEEALSPVNGNAGKRVAFSTAHEPLPVSSTAKSA